MIVREGDCVSRICTHYARDVCTKGAIVVTLDGTLKCVANRKVESLTFAACGFDPVFNLIQRAISRELLNCTNETMKYLKILTLFTEESQYSPTEKTGLDAET